MICPSRRNFRWMKVGLGQRFETAATTRISWHSGGGGAKYIVPVFKADPEGISELRKEADGKFVSASYEGFYKLKDEDKDPVMAASRPGRVYRALAIEIPAEDIEGRPDAFLRLGKTSRSMMLDSSFDIQTGINYTEFVRR